MKTQSQGQFKGVFEFCAVNYGSTVMFVFLCQMYKHFKKSDILLKIVYWIGLNDNISILQK